MKGIKRFLKQFFKGLHKLDPVVGDNGGIIYGRFDCIPDWLSEEDGDYWIWNADSKEYESCFSVKKITESELLSYMAMK